MPQRERQACTQRNTNQRKRQMERATDAGEIESPTVNLYSHERHALDLFLLFIYSFYLFIKFYLLKKDNSIDFIRTHMFSMIYVYDV